MNENQTIETKEVGERSEGDEILKALDSKVEQFFPEEPPEHILKSGIGILETVTTRIDTLNAMAAATRKGSGEFGMHKELVPHAVRQTIDGEQHTLLRNGENTLLVSRPASSETKKALINIQDGENSSHIWITEAGDIERIATDGDEIEITDETINSLKSKIDSFSPPEETPEMMERALQNFTAALQEQL